MGLDMALYKVRKGENGEYNIDESKEVAYWRKANAIHRFFVYEVQHGIDRCQLSEVSKEQLEMLLDLAKVALETEEPEECLPIMEGFFFGSYEYDSSYYIDLKETIEHLNRILDETDFENEKIFYQSSW